MIINKERSAALILGLCALLVAVTASRSAADPQPELPCPPSSTPSGQPFEECEPTYPVRDDEAVHLFPRKGLANTPAAPHAIGDNPCSQSTFGLVSQCWRYPWLEDLGSALPFVDPNASPLGAIQTAGFPLNINIYQIPRWTNLPPLNQSATESTAPLVASPIARPARPLFLTNRQTVAGVIDAVTGQPLLREVDLELPLGGSTYRVVRTYGGDPWREKVYGSTGAIGAGFDTNTNVMGRMWDWCGGGWMLGENPLLLVDSQHIWHDPTLPPRCELIIDAHHSIPFTKDVSGSVSSYASPSWFDAILNRRVENNVEKVDVYLYGKSTKYSFNIIKDDIYKIKSEASGLIHDASEPPNLAIDQGMVRPVMPNQAAIDNVPGSGAGIPNYAILKKIEDSHGNQVRIDHCVFKPRGNADWPETSDCQECLQNCTEKGQISTVKLINSDGRVQWTLLYIHRSFRLWDLDVRCAVDNYDYTNVIPWVFTARDADSAWFQQNALAAIYVFDGDRDFSQRDCWTVPADVFVKEGSDWIESIDQQDSFNWDDRFAGALNIDGSILSGWTHRLRYTYDEVCSGMHPLVQSPLGKIVEWGSSNTTEKRIPTLLRVERLSHTKLAVGTSEPPQRSFTAYTYANTPGVTVLPGVGHTDADGRAMPKVRSVFRQDGLNRMLEAYAGMGMTINAPFSPLPSNGSNSPAWRDLYLDRFAEMTFDWLPLATAESGAGTGIGDISPLLTSDFAKRLVISRQSAGGGVSDGYNKVAPLSGIQRESLFASGRIGVVSRAVLRQGGSSDGTYDMVYFHVAPPLLVDHQTTCPIYPLPPDDSRAFHGSSATSVVPAHPEECWGADVRAYGNPHPTCLLFPFNWQPPARMWGKVPPSPLHEPMWLVMADRHATPDDPNSINEYSIRDQVLIPSEYNGPLLPDSRQVIALNAAGYSLWSRNWDYLAGGEDAVGPSEEYVYESKSKVVPVLKPDGQPLLDSSNIPMETSVPVVLRLKEHRSLGWGVAKIDDSADPDSQGLITKYTYDDRVIPGTGEVEYTNLIKTVAVQEGVRSSGGDVYQSLLRSFEYPADLQAEDRESPVASIQYGGPSGTVQEQERYIARFYHTRGQDQDPNDLDRIKEEVTWGSAAPLWPGGPPLSQFQRRYFNEKGLLLSRAYGLAADPNADGWEPGENDLVFVDVMAYNRDGQPRSQVIDCDTSTGTVLLPEWWNLIGGLLPISTDPGEIPILPTPAYRRRIPQDLPGRLHLSRALHLCTGYRYDGPRTECVAKPDKRIDFVAMQTWELNGPGNPDVVTYSISALSTFLDGVFVTDGSNNHTLVFTKPGTVQVARDGKMLDAWTVLWQPHQGALAENQMPLGAGAGRYEFTGLQVDSLSVGFQPGSHLCSIVAKIEPEYDNAGRVTKATFTGQGVHQTEPIEQEAVYTDFGLVGKSVTPAGTVSRTVFNPLGQAVLEFRGTKDFSEYWQRLRPDGTTDDNLMPTRKNWYGTGIQDIRMPTQSRIFRSRPSTRPQEGYVDADGQFATSSNEDNYGWLERYGYDRRMRPVWAETRSDISGAASGDGDLLKVQATWLDNLDRPRFVGVFESDAASELEASAIDPRKMDVYLQGPPTAAQILDLKPASLIEYIYNARGEREEERRYDTRDPDGETYTASRSYFNHAGQPVTVISDGGRIAISLYDAIGRLASSVTFVDDNATPTITDAREIERTDNQYNRDAKLEVTSHYVRTLETGNALVAGPSGNAVRTDTINWYNDKQQLIATADIGTGSGDGTFTNTQTGSGGPETIPIPIPPSIVGSPLAIAPTWDAVSRVWEGYTWASYARISANEEYDDLGRVTKSRAPNGALTERTFDALNRVTDERITPTSGSVTRTAYGYEKGLLKYIGAVTPGHPNVINWDRRDGSIQITELVYRIDGDGPGAMVVDPFIQVDDPGAGYAVVSENFDWPRGVRLPWATCACDHNNSGTVTADDIFSFLDAWFVESANCMLSCSATNCSACTTDFNHSDTVTADDIFAFLDCWFAAPPNCGAASINAGNAEWVDVEFTYTIDGLIAERVEHITDTIHNRIQHMYDEFGRRTSIKVKSTQDLGNAATQPVATVDHIDYVYDILDRLTRTKAYSRDGAGSTTPSTKYIVADNAFAYDPFGHLLSERASYGEELTTNSSGAFTNGREITYGWQTRLAPGPTASSSPITHRLSQMALPWGPIGAADINGNPTPEQDRLLLAYSYGAPNSFNDALSRVQAIGYASYATPPPSTPSPIDLASFEYFGTSSRRGLILGPNLYGANKPAISQTLAGTSPTDPSLPHLDRFGRTTQLRYISTPAEPSTATELWKAEYAYDQSGNRTRERLWLGGPGSNINSTLGSDRSWIYAYDGHDRLISASSGIVNASGQYIRPADLSVTLSVPKFSETWALDHLGNWQSMVPTDQGHQPEGYTRTEYDNLGLMTSRQALDHKTGFRNQIEKIDSAQQDAVTQIWSPITARSIFYDAHGRTVFDGAHLYQHDLFGRVVQIRSAGLLDGNFFDPDTGLPSGDLGQVGQLIVHYTYDGLGRVIREQRPERPPITPPPGVAAGTPVTLRITDKYYDGVRPVQEVTQRGVALRQELTGTPPTTRTHYLPWRTDEFPTGQSRLTGPLSTTPGSAWSLEKAYVHAADPGAYVDEVLAQLVYLDDTGEPASDAITLYTLRDTNQNVVALADGYGRLAAQYTYHPYGKVRSAELMANPSTGPPNTPYWSRVLAAARSNRLGHQGLPVERLDASGPWSDPMGTDGTVPWNGVTNTALLGGLPPPEYTAAYHSRNRLYLPDWGRFSASDPNGTGLPILDSLTFGGMGLSASSINPDYQSHYGDGMNTHAAYGGNPLAKRDPSGLFYALDIGSEIGQTAAELVSQYSINLHYDLDWAMDWDQGDEVYSRLSNVWVDKLLAKRSADSMADAMFGPLAMLRDLVELGSMIGEYIINDGEDWESYGDEDEAGGPAMAASSRGGFRSPMQSLLKHGGDYHQRLIGRLISRGRGMGADWFNVRVNRQLIDPKTNQTLSKRRPDYFAFVEPNKIILGEAVTDPAKNKINAKKLEEMAKEYRALGYQVHKMPIQN